MKAVIEEYFNILKPEIIKAIEGQIAKYPNQNNTVIDWVKICEGELKEIISAPTSFVSSSFPGEYDRVIGETIEAIACMVHMLMDTYNVSVVKQVALDIRERG